MDTVKREQVIFSNISTWEDYMKRLKIPDTDIERTRNHYLCIMQFEKMRSKIWKNIFSVFSIPVVLILLKKKSKHREIRTKCDAVEYIVIKRSTSSKIRKSLPAELKREFPRIITYEQKADKKHYLTGVLDINVMKKWLCLVRKYPLAFYMNLSMLLNLTEINRIFYQYHPKAIFVKEAENKFVTSYLTAFCENLGMEYIGIQHGDYFVTPIHAFVRFSRFYVWDEYYIEQYVKTGSDRKFFRVYEPEKLHFDLSPNNTPKDFYITYYLQGQNEEQLRSIYHTLIK